MLEKLGQVWTCLNQFGQVKPIWTSLNQFGQVFNNPEAKNQYLLMRPMRYPKIAGYQGKVKINMNKSSYEGIVKYVQQKLQKNWFEQNKTSLA